MANFATRYAKITAQRSDITSLASASTSQHNKPPSPTTSTATIEKILAASAGKTREQRLNILLKAAKRRTRSRDTVPIGQLRTKSQKNKFSDWSFEICEDPPAHDFLFAGNGYGFSYGRLGALVRDALVARLSLFPDPQTAVQQQRAARLGLARLGDRRLNGDMEDRENWETVQFMRFERPERRVRRPVERPERGGRLPIVTLR